MFGSRLAQERKRLGLSQRDLAERMGIGRSAVGMIETDRSPLDAERLVSLGDHGFDVLFVLTGERGHVAAGRLLDWDLCIAIYQRIDAWSKRRGVRLPDEKVAVLVKLLYLQAALRGTLDDTTFNESMRIAA